MKVSLNILAKMKLLVLFEEVLHPFFDE